MFVLRLQAVEGLADHDVGSVDGVALPSPRKYVNVR